MREPPNLADATILAALRAHYDLSIAALTFLPIGDDPASAVYRVDTVDGAAYFLKTRAAKWFSPSSVAVPRYLHEMEIPHIVAPIPTTSQTSWVMVNDFAFILYPFIERRVGAEVGLSDRQWTELGRTLKQIHATQLPPELKQTVLREAFVPYRRALLPGLENAIGGVLTDPVQRELADFWHSQRDLIRKLVDRADTLGSRLRESSTAQVLCHADLHPYNVLLEGNDRLWLVDWDDTILAPTERDLMFFVGGIARDLVSPHDTECFFRGYGDAPIDPVTLAYYRYGWAVQDITAYAEEVFFLPDLGEKPRRFAFSRFKQLFEPGNIVDLALASDRAI